MQRKISFENLTKSFNSSANKKSFQINSSANKKSFQNLSKSRNSNAIEESF